MKRIKHSLVWGLVVALSIIFPLQFVGVYASESKTYEQIKILVDILGYVKENYVEDVETQKLVYGAAAGMVKTLDPFSQFMEPKIHKEMKVETKGEFGGLGIRISIRDNWLTVITPLPGTPAYKAGIQSNDRIIKIEGEGIYNIDLEDAVSMLRGKPGTDVTITISREDINEKGEKLPEIKDYTITRAVIKIESINSRMVTDSIGYVQLIEFTKNTYNDLHAAMKSLKENGMENFILDLRNNPGGLLDIAVDVCDEFLEKDQLIVYTQGRDPVSRNDYKAVRSSEFSQLPMVVLINEGSASGSEIVAGALQDNQRAVIVGERTFGKASVQSVIPLSDGSGLRLTTAHYYTPSGAHIHKLKDAEKWGIDPDIEIKVTRETKLKLRTQNELVYEKGKNPKSEIPAEEQVKDEVLERAVEIFKTRKLFEKIKVFEPAEESAEKE
ncbi:MAG: S41 family peptidase [bacterium]